MNPTPSRAGRAPFAALSLVLPLVVAAAFALGGAARAATPPPLSPAARMTAQESAFAAAPAGESGDIARLVALYRFAEAAAQASDQDSILPALQAMAATPGLSPLLRGEVEAEVAARQLNLGHAAAAAEIWRRLGMLEEWRALGPFDNPTPGAITAEAGPEKGIDLAAHYAGKQAQVRWRRLPFPAAEGAYNLGLFFTPSQSASAYLVIWVNSPSAQAVALRLTDGGATRIWVNGKLLFDEEASHRAPGFDMHAVGAGLRAGWNEMLVKTGATESNSWHFSLRLTTPQGAPLPLPASADPQTLGAGPDAPALAVRDLTAEAKAAASTPAGAWNYAWVLAKKNNFNSGDDLAANAFLAAAALDPKNPRILLDFAEHDGNESRRSRTLDQALALDPANPEALSDRGFVELSRREFWPARADFERALAGAAKPTDLPQALLGLFAVYSGFGLRAPALRYADQLQAAGYDRAPAVGGIVVQTLRRMDDASAALRWARALAAASPGALGAHAALADLQRESGQFTAAIATLRASLALTPDVPLLRETLARALAGAGEAAPAVAEIQAAAALDPQNPDLRAAAGDIEEHFGRRQAALADWRQALALNPQAADLRDRLSLARGGEGGAAVEASFEQPYAVNLEQAIANYQKDPRRPTGGALVLLVDSTVARIFPSGNVGKYVQQIYRVNDDAGARQLATYAVTYDPSNQTVRYLAALVRHPDGSIAEAPEAEDSPVSEAVGYETFYDVRNKWVSLPAIQPGDYVEIAYRILPSTLESLYGQYYGDIIPFQSEAGEQFQQFVVIAPDDQPLHVAEVRFSGQKSVIQKDGDTIYTWTLKDEPAYVPEPHSPPAIEEQPYVVVSTFANWDQFADWYRGLIRDTFVFDDQLRQTTDQLVRGLTTQRQKVEAIYNYVIRNTHYVALEFGIHGYRPYPIAEVFHRRFGDCKDKASLLAAMLARAGVPADLVLVRTRDLGLVDPNIPAVADFDHAIVYVPSLNLYLDGTTEYNGVAELPDADQRAFVFRIPVLLAEQRARREDAAAREAGAPSAAGDDPRGDLRPVVTPELSAAADSTRRDITGRLDAAGDLDFTAQWTLEGGEAPALRAGLVIPERQAGALQAMLRGNLPGISVYTAAVADDDEWNQPLKVTFQGRVPRFATVDGAGNGAPLLIPRQFVARSWLPRLAALSSRQSPVLLGPPREISETLSLTLPAGYHLSPPPAWRLDAPFARASVAFQLRDSGRDVVITTQLQILRSEIPVAEYAAFRDFWAKVDQQFNRPLRAAPASLGGDAVARLEN